MRPAEIKPPPMVRPPQSLWTKLHVYAAELLTQLGPPAFGSCTQLDVLGVARGVCIDRPIYSPLPGIELFAHVVHQLRVDVTDHEMVRLIAKLIIGSQCKPDEIDRAKRKLAAEREAASVQS